MNLKTYASSILLILGCFTVMPAAAFNYGFIEETPTTRFTREDNRIFNETMNDTLNNAADGETRTWSNPKTRASGEITPIKSFDRDGLACRTARIRNIARGRTGDNTFNFCKQQTGEWQLAN